MALEPRSMEAEEDTSELDYMPRRFWVSTVLALPVFFSATAPEFWPEIIAVIIKPHYRNWFELVLATPVVLWGGWVFFVRCWQPIEIDQKTDWPIHTRHSLKDSSLRSGWKTVNE